MLCLWRMVSALCSLGYFSHKIKRTSQNWVILLKRSCLYPFTRGWKEKMFMLYENKASRVLNFFMIHLSKTHRLATNSWTNINFDVLCIELLSFVAKNENLHWREKYDFLMAIMLHFGCKILLPCYENIADKKVIRFWHFRFFKRRFPNKYFHYIEKINFIV